MKTLFKLALISLSFNTFACNELPTALGNNGQLKEVCDQELKVKYGYDVNNKRSTWASYKLGSLAPVVHIKNRGVYPSVPELSNDKQPNLKAYSANGYDKGYLVPPFNIVHSPRLMTRAFMKSNIFPIEMEAWRGEFGKVVWQLNNSERRIFTEKGVTDVLAGVIYAQQENINIPPPISYFYKIYRTGPYDLIKAYMIPVNVKEHTALNDFFTSIDCIESLANIDIKIVKSDEDDVENRIAVTEKIWARKDGDSSEASCDI